MVVKVLIVAAAVFLLAPTTAAPPDTHKKIGGLYRIYGGTLGDPLPPSKIDKKIMFSIEGQAAKDIFDVIGPDVADLCTEGSGDRVRKRDGEKLVCSRTANGEYYCNFGFDLRTGKSIGGSVC